MSSSGLNAGNHYRFKHTKGLFKKVVLQTCIYESKVRHDPSLSKNTHSDDVTLWNWRNKPLHLMPHAGAVLEEQERGRAEDAETFLQSYLWQVQ